MASKYRNVSDLLGAAESKDIMELIYSAEQEATEADQFYYRYRHSPDDRTLKSKEYAEALKELIARLRSSVMT